MSWIGFPLVFAAVATRPWIAARTEWTACRFDAIGNISCPFCEGTLAIYRLMRGNAIGAWHANGFVTTTALFLVLLWIYSFAATFFVSVPLPCRKRPKVGSTPAASPPAKD